MPFGITPLHLIVVLLVALVILGPRALPKLGSRVGRSIRELRQAVPATRDAFTAEIGSPSTVDPVAGRGAAAGAKVGSTAARSLRGFREALSESRNAFETEMSPPSAAASPPRTPHADDDAVHDTAPPEGSPPSGG